MNQVQRNTKPTIRDARNYFKRMITKEQMELHPFYKKGVDETKFQIVPAPRFEIRSTSDLWKKVEILFSIFEERFVKNGQKMTTADVDSINKKVAAKFSSEELRYLSMLSFLPWAPAGRLDIQKGIPHIIEANRIMAKALFSRINVSNEEIIKIVDLGAGLGTTSKILIEEKPADSKLIIGAVEFNLPFYRFYEQVISTQFVNTDNVRIVTMYEDMVDCNKYLSSLCIYDEYNSPHAIVASYSWHHLCTKDQEWLLSRYHMFKVPFIAIADPSGRSPYNRNVLCSTNPGDTIFANFSHAEELAKRLDDNGYKPEILQNDMGGNAGYIILAERKE